MVAGWTSRVYDYEIYVGTIIQRCWYGWYDDDMSRQLGVEKAVNKVSNEQWKNHGCLGYIGDLTTQLYGDYSKPV